MALRVWTVHCLRPEAPGREVAREVGSYRESPAEELKSNDIIETKDGSYRIVFFVHTEPTRQGGKLVVVPAR